MEEIFKKGEKAALFTGIGTVFFAALKGLAGFLSGSVVLMADALHGLSDSVTTFLAWIGLKIAKREPTERFPYGFYKAENIAALLISIFIFLSGFGVLRISWQRFLEPRTVAFSYLSVAVPVFDGLTMFFLGRRELKAGRRINSQSLIADGKEARSHVFLSFVVLAGLGFSYMKIPYLEAVTAVFISFFIFREGLESFKGAVFSLLDVSPGGETEQRIRWVLENISGLRGFQNLKLRRSGPFVFGQVKAEVVGSTDVKRAREISKGLEEKIKQVVPSVDSFTVALAPFKGKTQRVVFPVERDKGLDSELASRFGRAPSFLLVDLEEGEATDFYAEKNPYREKEIRAGLAAADFLSEKKMDSVVTREIGPIALHTLRDQLVEIFTTEEETAGKALEKLGKGGLEPITEATKRRK